jgi:hypothetical protein
MASSLPNNPSLERLRRDARRLQRDVTAGAADAIALMRRHHPKPVAVPDDPMTLHDAQLTVARRYGFTGWPALVHYLETAAALSFDPGRVDDAALGAADRFCAQAVLRYDDTDAPPRRQAAADLLAAEPGLVDRHVWAAAAATDVDALRRRVRADSGAASAPGGPFGWPPLMYLAHTRVPLSRTVSETLDAAEVLLDAGADPNGGYLWCGMATPFTVLTGVFGEGEQGPRRQPRHQHADEFATLLLARGAHPVDQQALYNRMFRPDDGHLHLLFAHGLATAGPSPWERRLGEAMETRAQMWRRQVEWAAAHGFTERLALLARHGVDVTGVRVVEPHLPADPNAVDDTGATALHHAAWDGDLERIRALLDLGADPTRTDSRFDATPLGWAEHGYQTEAADLLRQYGNQAPT